MENSIFSALSLAFRQACGLWAAYWEGSLFVLVFAASAVFLAFARKKSRPAKDLLAWILLVLFFFFCPVSALVLQKLIGADVYWRVLWLLAFVPACAAACTEAVRLCGRPAGGPDQSESPAAPPASDGAKGRLLPGAAAVLCLAVIVLAGKGMLRAGSFERMHNYQQVPTEIPHICNLLHEQEQVFGQDRVYIAADDHVVTWMRIYDPSVLQAYGRYGRGAVNSWAAAIYEQISSPLPNYDVIEENLSNLTVNFLVFPITDADVAQSLCAYGWEMVGHINDYYIYYVRENGEKLIQRQSERS